MAQTATQNPRNGEGHYKNPLHTDFRLIDALSQFNRERIPERAVHAKGAGAYGEFEVTHDVSDVCNIDILLSVGKKTPVVTRFSTTALESGSSEMYRDMKGMAVRFFTEQGNWDLVNLSLPIFFIRDPSKFPSLMHASRRDPKTNLLNPNLWWDWVCKNPESLHLTLILWGTFGGNFFNWRTMNGYSNHPFKWVKPDGTWNYVQMAFESDQNPYTSSPLDTSDPDCSTQDLYDAFDREEYPTWRVRIQVLNPQEILDVGFHALDLTKHWPEAGFHYPKCAKTTEWRDVGKITLKQKPEDHFSEIEQLALSPSNLVPGVEPSEDPMLQARLFAYPDAQRYRLGPQSQQLPANRPKTSAFLDQPRVLADTESDPKRIAWLAKTSSEAWSNASEEDFTWARGFWEELPVNKGPEFADNIITNISISVAKTDKDLREKLYALLNRVATDLSDRVREATEKIVAEQEAKAGNGRTRQSQL